MITLIIRVIIIYILILFVFRLMGKRQIGQMQPFELVLTLIIADLATIPMAEISVPILNGIVPLLMLVVFHFLLTTLTRISHNFSKFISGKPVIIVTPKGIDYVALKKLNITIDDLFEAIRSAGCFSLSEVEYAIMETNGEVSVMPKNSPATCEDLNIQTKPNEIPLTIISDGTYMEENIKLSKRPKEFFEKYLNQQNVKKIKNVLLLTITTNGEIFFQQKGHSCVTTNVGEKK